MKKIFIIIIALLATFRSYADEPLKIAYLTDNHVGSAGNNADFEACVADINTLDSISFVLVGGDITHMGSDIQIHTGKKILDKLNVPYWVVSGNHDSKWSESGCNTFIRTFGYEQFDFEAGGYRFLGC
ncbi:MAG: metallophosphoesterase [Treponema sp.]|nr:metallophosphoesterase [Treponema sp.]